MIEAEQGSAGDNEEVKKMLADHDKLVEEIFQHEDKDKNGFISHDEFSGPKHDELWSLRAASPRLRAPRRRRRRVSRHHVFTSARNRLLESCPAHQEHHWTQIGTLWQSLAGVVSIVCPVCWTVFKRVTSAFRRVSCAVRTNTFKLEEEKKKAENKKETERDFFSWKKDTGPVVRSIEASERLFDHFGNSVTANSTEKWTERVSKSVGGEIQLYSLLPRSLQVPSKEEARRSWVCASLLVQLERLEELMVKLGLACRTFFRTKWGS